MLAAIYARKSNEQNGVDVQSVTVAEQKEEQS